MEAVRLHCQTMALQMGFPVFLSQTTVVSRWFVMPMAAISCTWMSDCEMTSIITP